MSTLDLKDMMHFISMPEIAKSFKQSIEEASWTNVCEAFGEGLSILRNKERIQLIDRNQREVLSTRSEDLKELTRLIVTAFATDLLTNSALKKVALIGTSKAAKQVLIFLLQLRPLKDIHVYDSKPFQAGVYCAKLARDLKLNCIAEDTLSDALFEAGLTLISMPADYPYLYPDILQEGSTIGSLSEHNNECSVDLLQAAQIYCDDKQKVQQIDFYDSYCNNELLDALKQPEVQAIKLYRSSVLEEHQCLVMRHLYQRLSC